MFVCISQGISWKVFGAFYPFLIFIALPPPLCALQGVYARVNYLTAVTFSCNYNIFCPLHLIFATCFLMLSPPPPLQAHTYTHTRIHADTGIDDECTLRAKSGLNMLACLRFAYVTVCMYVCMHLSTYACITSENFTAALGVKLLFSAMK